MTMRPERVLEIGTFRAGTARFMAQALHHAGRGALYTIDPYGIENNVPAIIQSWPTHLQHHVRFFPVDSAFFFDQAMITGTLLDLVLIDGNHELEYAAFDLACTARVMNSGGIVVLDNVEQPGPRYATQQFLIANPDWHEVPGAVAQGSRSEFERPQPLDGRNLASRDLRFMDMSDPFGFVAPSFPDTKFFVLKAPSGLIVSNIPRSFGSNPTAAAGARRLEFDLARPASGMLHYQIFCRAFSESALPEELTTIGAVEINHADPSKVMIELNSPLVLKTPHESAQYRVEIICAFVPANVGDRLYLRRPPRASDSDSGYQDRVN